MNAPWTALIVLGVLSVAVLLGRALRRRLPEALVTPPTLDTVKISVGLVATMSALLLGLLINSAKGSFDSARVLVIQMAAKATYLDRVLDAYGPESSALGGRVHDGAAELLQELWPPDGSAPRLNRESAQGNALYTAILELAPKDERQKALKGQAVRMTEEIGQLRSTLTVQLYSSVSVTLFCVVVSWLVVIFFSFSLVSPGNATAVSVLLVTAASVSGAAFLILELGGPFSGLIQVSSAPLIDAMKLISK